MAIQQLSENVINKIAAGEVVENPSSVLRELLDNSIDAKADEIEITLDLEGDFAITIKDNGIGISKQEMPLAFSRYATSKLTNIDEVYELNYLGFRGEALASIAAISKVVMDSSTAQNGEGNRVIIRGGKIEQQQSCAATQGTKIAISDIFYNTPVRKKFLKSLVTEQSNIKSEIIRHVLATENIGFRYQVKKNGKMKSEFNIAKNFSLKDKICFFFRQIDSSCLAKIDYESEEFKISGYVTNHKYRAKTKRHQYLIVGDRVVKNNTFSAALDSAYVNILPSKTFCASFLKVSAKIKNFIDINIHPAKKEVKFQDNRIFYHHIHQSVKDQLYRSIYQGQKQSIESSLDKNEKLTINPNDASENYQSKNFKTSPLELNDFVQKKFPTRKLQDDKLQDDKFLNKNSETQNNFESSQEDEKKIETNSDFFNQQQNQENFSQETNGEINNKTNSEISDEVNDDINNDINNDISSQIKEQIEILGQLAKSYIVFSINKDLFIADQHAVHERINFDDLQNNFKNKKITQQYLLVPLVVRRNKADIDILLEYKDLFSKIGFEIDKFSKENIQVERVPSFIKEKRISLVFESLADLILENPSLKIEEFFEKTISTMACRMSIMAGDIISKQEMQELILALYEKDYIYNCPHGRPFVKKISFKEMSNFFERGAHLPGL